MINQLLKAGLFIQLVAWLKPRYKVLVIVVGSITVASIAHSEYLSYIDHTDDKQYLQLSYVIKWSIIFISILGYIIFTRLRFSHKKKKEKITSKQRQDNHHNIKHDGFDFIRNKPIVESQADKVLKANQSKRGKT